MTSTPPTTPRDDEFYIGYDPPMPPRIAVRVRRAVAVVLAAVLLLAVAALAAHRRLTPATFDYGRPQALGGHLVRAPYPQLVVDGRRALLVGRGKHGADTALAAVPDGPVTLSGTRIERGGRRMFEVVPGSAAPVSRGASGVVPSPPSSRPGTRSVPSAPGPNGTAVAPKVAESAQVTLHGEIVDSKCFLGVMNPGEGTVHRDCARVCLRGGIPPMLLVRGGHAEERLVLLVDTTGGPIGRDLADVAGVPVAVRGLLARDGDQLVLATTRAQVVPLPAP